MPNEFDSEAMSDPEISVAVLGNAVPEDRPLAGEQFGKYLLVGDLATGGMAQIFLAVHQGLEGFNRVVALKRVLPELTDKSELVQMFLDEARLAARLEHPNIVRTYEFGAEANLYYLVMEYLAGEDLNAVLGCALRSHQPLSISFIVKVVSRICAGLHFAHELSDSMGRPLGLVHRDVTPSNIVVTYFGEVKLIDFGVAKAASNVVQTRAGMLKGKISYMSPEQLRARGIDRRSDVFSTGIVLWEMLTGQRLFARDTDAATLYAILDDPIPPIRMHRADVPDELAAIVVRALARDPGDRWQTAEDMQLALDSFLATQPVRDLPRAQSEPSAADVGARGLAREMEQLFGAPRSHAKRSIAQGRALTANIAVIGKLHGEVPAVPIGSFDQALTAQRIETPSMPARRPRRSRRGWLFGLIGVAVLAAGGLSYLIGHRDAAVPDAANPVSPANPASSATAALTVTSVPAGASIYIAGEPTGMITPATLANVAPGRIAIRLELAGYPTSETVVTLAPGAALTQEIRLGGKRSAGRLVLVGLPNGSSVVCDGEDHVAGEVIPVASGRHTIQVVVDGHPIAQQTIETTAGDQVWELTNHELVPRRPR